MKSLRLREAAQLLETTIIELSNIVLDNKIKYKYEDNKVIFNRPDLEDYVNSTTYEPWEKEARETFDEMDDWLGKYNKNDIKKRLTHLNSILGQENAAVLLFADEKESILRQNATGIRKYFTQLGQIAFEIKQHGTAHQANFRNKTEKYLPGKIVATLKAGIPAEPEPDYAAIGEPLGMDVDETKALMKEGHNPAYLQAMTREALDLTGSRQAIGMSYFPFDMFRENVKNYLLTIGISIEKRSEKKQFKLLKAIGVLEMYKKNDTISLNDKWSKKTKENHPALHSYLHKILYPENGE